MCVGTKRTLGLAQVHNTNINSGMQKRRFSLLLHAGHGKRYGPKKAQGD